MASVDIDVRARVAQRSLRDAASQMEAQMRLAGQAAGRDFGRELAAGIQGQAPRVQSSLARVTDATRRLQVEQNLLNDAVRRGDYDRIVQASARVERAHREHESSLRSLRNAQDEVERGSSSLTGTLAQVGSAMGKAAGPAAAAALGLALQGIVGVASAASGALGVLPGAAAAAGAGFGTLKLATMGFSDALDNISDPEKFSEALQKLSPNAQSAATSIRNLVPAFDEVKNATQDALFANVGPQLTQLTSTLMPAVKQMTTTVAGAFNTMFSGVATQLQNPATLAAINATMANIGAAFTNLAPAAAPLTAALAELTKVSSGFLPEIAKGATEAATAFSKFITEASRSGELGEWIRTGLDMLKQLGPLALDVGRAFLAFAPVGERIMPMIVDTMDTIADILQVIVPLAAEFSPAFSTAEAAIGAVGGAVDLLGQGFNAVKGIVDDVTDGIIGSMNVVGKAISDALAPLRAGAKLAGIDIPEYTPILPRGGAVVPRGIPTSPTPSGAGAGATLPGAQPAYGSLGASALVPPQTGPSWGPPKSPFAYEPPKSSSAGSGSGSGDLTAYQGDPMSLLGRVAVTSSLYSAASSVLDARHSAEEAQAELNKLSRSNTATQSDITKAQNDLLKAQQQTNEAEMRLNEQKLSSTQKLADQYGEAADSLNGVAAELDKDFGISKGLPGIVENLTRAIGNLAAAPYLGQLQAIQDADPRKGGFGMVGIAAAQGAFGPENTGMPQPGTSMSSAATPGGYPGAPAPVPGAMPGESARDFAHRVMMPFWQSQGLTVGDHAADKYGEHQNGALDIMVPSLAEGSKVLQQVLSDPNVYGAIFNNQTFGYGHGLTPKDYGGGHTGNPTQDHQDHVHALYKPGGANNIIPGGAGGSPITGAMTAPVLGAGPSSLPSMPSSLPIPLPVVVVGGGAGIMGAPIGAAPVVGAPPSAPFGSPASGIGAGPLPGPVAGLGGGGMMPGIGMPQGLPMGQSPIGQASTAPVGGSGTAGWQPQGGGGIGPNGGGALGAAADAGSMALDAMAPGAGQAAATAGKAINRTIQYGGQLASIGMSGLLQTFGISSDGAAGDLSNSWLGRIASGVSGMAAAMPTTAGQTKTPAAQPQQNEGSGAQQGNGQGGNTFHTVINQGKDRSYASVVNEMQFQANHKGSR